MAHFTELSADLQAALDRAIPARTTTEIILDPDDKNIDLSEYLDGDSSLRISKSKSILPAGSLGKYTMGEVSLEMVNTGDEFNHNKKVETFYYVSSRLYFPKLAGDIEISVPSGDGAKFAVGYEMFPG